MYFLYEINDIYISVHAVVTMFQKIFMFIPITRVMISGELT